MLRLRVFLFLPSFLLDMARDRVFGNAVDRRSPMGEGIESETSLKSFGSVLTRDVLGIIWGICFILAEFKVELTGLRERVHLSPPEWLGVYDDALKADLRFPLHPFIIKLMNAFMLSPSQIIPNL